MNSTIGNETGVALGYNLLINGINRFSQLLAPYKTVAREHRVPVSIFKFLVNGSMQNEYGLYLARARGMVQNCYHIKS